jgi:hypothetical protein
MYRERNPFEGLPGFEGAKGGFSEARPENPKRGSFANMMNTLNCRNLMKWKVPEKQVPSIL